MRVKRNYGVHKYADGGEVEVNKKAKKAKKPKPKDNALANYGTMQSTKEKMDKLGLKDGGKVKMKPHVPPKVKDPIKEKMKSSPGGPQTPGEKGTYPKKMACGGKVRK